MADKFIRDLTPATSLAPTHTLPLDQSASEAASLSLDKLRIYINPIPSTAYRLYYDDSSGYSNLLQSYNLNTTTSSPGGTNQYYEFDTGSSASAVGTRYRVNARIGATITSMGAFVDFCLPTVSAGGDTFKAGLAMYGDYENPDDNSMGLRTDASNNLYVGRVSGSVETKCSTPYTPAAGTWYRAGWVYDKSAGTITGYINGEPFGSITSTPPAAFYSGDYPIVLSGLVKLSGTTARQLRWKNGVYFFN